MPVLVGFADHASNQIDVDLRKADLLQPTVGFENLRREMCPAVFFQNLVLKILDPQRDPRDADFFKRFDFLQAQRARFAFEGNFLGGLPREMLYQTVAKRQQLPGAQIGRRATAEVGKLQFAAPNARLLADQIELVFQSLDVILDRVRVLLRVDPKVTEPAPLAAEGNVYIQSQRHARVRLLRERLERVGHRLPRPLRKGRIVRDKITADFRRFTGVGGHGRSSLLRSETIFNCTSRDCIVHPIR